MALRLVLTAATCTGGMALASKPWGGGQSASKPPRELLGRGAYAHFEMIPTRWNDMDAQQHVNNAVYHFYIDDAVNLHLSRSGVSNDIRRFTSENSCRYLRQLSWPTRAGPVSTPYSRRQRRGGAVSLWFRFPHGSVTQPSRLACAYASAARVRRTSSGSSPKMMKTRPPWARSRTSTSTPGGSPAAWIHQ